MPNSTFSRALRNGLLIAMLALLTACQTTPAPVALSTGTPTSAIFIGNSFFYFNNGITSHLAPMVRESNATPSFRSTMVTISGSGFNWHDVDSYFRPNAIGTYSFDANNNVVFNKLDRLFDVAILMDCSQCPIHPQLKDIFRDYAKKNADSVRKYGARPVFFMSWAYADAPQMTAQLEQAYTAAGKEHNALVIPAGLAFARSVARRPALNLYAPDKRHPSVAGTYLAACTTFASLFGKSPVGLKFNAGLDAETAAFLQSVAWETVQAYGRQ